jgi:hypothetical protein
MLNRLESKHPGLKYTIARSVEKLSAPAIGRNGEERVFRACKVCGDPTPNNVCEACIMLRSLNTDLGIENEGALQADRTR